MEETKEEMSEPSLKLENMHRLSYLESIVQGMSDQLRVIISKQNQLTNFLLKRPSDFSQVLCQLAENTQSSNHLKWVLKDAIQKLVNKKPQKIVPPAKPIEERINMSHFHPGVIPTLDHTFLQRYDTYKSTQNYEKFLTIQKIDDITTFDMKKKTIYPQMFAHFLYIFLQNPKNCAFHKKNDRCYACKSDNDYWEKVETDDFWTEVREFLWESYVAYLQQLEKDIFSVELTDRLHKMSEKEIPVNKTGLIWLLYRQKQLPGQVRLGQLLVNAYNSRNLKSAL